MALIIQDTFTVSEDADLAVHFTNTGQSWGVNTGYMRVQASDDKCHTLTATPFVAEVLYSDYTNLKNCTVQAEVNPAPNFWVLFRRAGIFGRRSHVTGQGMYALFLNSSGLWLVWQPDNGDLSGYITLSNYSFSPATGTAYTLKLSMQGTTIQGYLNGVLRVSATDSRTAFGQTGFIVDAQNTSYPPIFDSITVNTLTNAYTETGRAWSMGLAPTAPIRRLAVSELARPVNSGANFALPTQRRDISDLARPVTVGASPSSSQLRNDNEIAKWLTMGALVNMSSLKGWYETERAFNASISVEATFQKGYREDSAFAETLIPDETDRQANREIGQSEIFTLGIAGTDNRQLSEDRAYNATTIFQLIEDFNSGKDEFVDTDLWCFAALDTVAFVNSGFTETLEMALSSLIQVFAGHEYTELELPLEFMLNRFPVRTIIITGEGFNMVEKEGITQPSSSGGGFRLPS